VKEIGDMDEGIIIKTLIGVLGGLLMLVGYLLKVRIDRAERDIIDRVRTSECGLLHTNMVEDVIDLKKHHHATTGEVIL
jgi:hypothetical protein